MKKKRIWVHVPNDVLLKFWKIMRLSVFFLLLFAAQTFATATYSQETRLTLKMQGAKVIDVLDKIEGESEFFFLFNQKLLDVERKVTIDVKNENIDNILNSIFASTNVSYVVKDRQIILTTAFTVSESGQQQKSLSGKIIESSGVPLPGVTIVIKGTTIGTISDPDGNYSLLKVPEDAVLQYSFVGMKMQELAVKGKTTINVTLEEETTEVNEVVAIGYGSVQKKELTSAVTSIASKDLLQGAFNSPLQMLDGKVAGVTISNPAAADPNRSTDIQVRGASSIDAGNGPLIIIDGMPGGDLRNVAQQDIESMTVLKDGSAAAIYGSRAANGVILVQTKKGKSGKVVITYDSYIDRDVVSAKPDILSPEEFLSHKIDIDRGGRTNWYDELIRKDNLGQNHFLSASGGNDNTMFRISANFRDKTAIDIASERQETGIRASFQQKAMDGFLELNGNLSYKTAIEEYSNYNVFQQAVKLNPTIPVMDPADPSGYYRMYGYDTFNPVQDLKERENGADQTYSILDFTVKLNLLKNLNTEIKLARQDHDQFKREYYTSKAKESVDNKRTGRARLQDEKWTDYTLEWIGNYYANIGKSNFKLMGGYSYQEFNNHAFWAENMDFPSDAFKYNNLDAGKWQLEKGRLGMDSWKSKEKTIAFFGRANYNYDNKFLLAGTVRYEGNTKFGKQNKWGIFPAGSAAWRLSEMSFIKDISFINDLKLRVSYGETGRSGFNRYSSLSRYQGFGKWQNDEGQWIQVYGPANNPNPDLRWEKQISYNLGVDFSLFKNRLSGSADAFIRQGKDVITNYDTPVPPFLHDQIFTNVGSTSAKGVELNINWIALQKKNFTYQTNITTSYILSKLDKFSNGTFTKGFMNRYDLPSPGNPGYAQRLEDNTEIGSFYGYKYAGVDESGKIMIWRNGIVDGEKVNASSEGKETDKTYLGHGSPRIEMTWGNNFTYKSFDLSLYFRGRFDYKILNTYQMYYGLVAEPGVNLLRDAYTRNGQITSGKVITDYFLEDGDYIKLDNLTLGWSPKINSSRFSNFRLYGTVKNVFTLTKFTGLDPTTVNTSGLEPGIADLNVYPITRNYTLGVQITF